MTYSNDQLEDDWFLSVSRVFVELFNNPRLFLVDWPFVSWLECRTSVCTACTCNQVLNEPNLRSKTNEFKIEFKWELQSNLNVHLGSQPSDAFNAQTMFPVWNAVTLISTRNGFSYEIITHSTKLRRCFVKYVINRLWGYFW